MTFPDAAVRNMTPEEFISYVSTGDIPVSQAIRIYCEHIGSIGYSIAPGSPRPIKDEIDAMREAILDSLSKVPNHRTLIIF